MILLFPRTHLYPITVEQVLIAWFNDCIWQVRPKIVNPIIAKVDPVVCAQVYEKYLQFAINRYTRNKKSSYSSTCGIAKIAYRHI